MKLIHIIAGELAAQPLREALLQDPDTNSELLVLQDQLQVGPLKTEDMGFSQGRTRFWQELQPELIHAEEIDDLERLMALSTRMSNQEDIQVWFWMAATPADVCAYYWLLHYLKKHQGKLFVVNGIGLPFIDDAGKLFYPDSWSELPPKEIIKAHKLARMITPSEWETDGEEWQQMVSENADMRTLAGGKKLKPTNINAYDNYLLSCCKTNFQKGIRIVHQAMAKNKIFAGDYFLVGRLNEMVLAGILEKNKTEYKLAGNSAASSTGSDEEKQALS